MAKSGFVIAAATSGSGKTTLALGLLRCLKERGAVVAPFKCGPDYIDPMWHRAACGRASINLDVFLSSEDHVRRLFGEYSSRADVAVAEGVMGMFDGYERMKGSCADVARILDIPVVLLVNAASTSYSVAATIFGFRNFRPETKIAGVIFNRVASERHFSFLKDACADAGVACLGRIARLPEMEMPSRYLGLSIESQQNMERFISRAAEAVAAGVDIDALLGATEIFTGSVPAAETRIQSEMTVAVACDDAFNFIYPANIRAMEERGATVKFFSPLNDSTIPDCDMLYLPGGYPELYARQLAANADMLHAVRDFAERGGRVLAECGGMIYLMRAVDGMPMCDVLPMDVTMENAKLSLGYRTVDFGGNVWRGHEFHYSHVANPDALSSVALQRNASGREVNTPVYRYKNVIATYTHLYWGDRDITDLWR